MDTTRYWLSCVLIGLLASCVPALEDETAGTQVALINAPAGVRVSFIADALQEQVLEVAGCCEFSFTRSQPVRFQETHRDMFGSRAAPQSASLARNLGAQLAVMAGAPLFERTVNSADGGREIHGSVELRAIVIDAASARQLATVGSLTFTASRFASENEPLPELEQDPIMVELGHRAVANLAPHLAAVLEDLAGDF
ncbi:MAG: hypothetical protein WD273_09575 [Trueperaceae bacterium]